eukprot:1304063-Amphidinium_carterae.1
MLLSQYESGSVLVQSLVKQLRLLKMRQQQCHCHCSLTNISRFPAHEPAMIATCKLCSKAGRF